MAAVVLAVRAIGPIITILFALILPGNNTGADEGDAMIDPGAPFPTFELEAHDGTTIRSADLAGSPYLVYFYPKADTPGCTREACELRDRWEDVEAIGLKVFGVSYDTPKKNAAFATKYKLPFQLLSDEDHGLAKAVGASSMLLPFPKRVSYLIGADGTVLKAYPKVVPADHAGEVIQDLAALTD